MIASQNWLSFGWTEWVPFDGGDFKLLPTAAGIYRVRIRDQDRLAYIGQTGRNLRERLSDLRRNTLVKEMPFNDPHTAAPSLWAWRDAGDTNMNVRRSQQTLMLSTGRRLNAGCSGSTDWKRVSPHSAIMGTSTRTMRNPEIGKLVSEGIGLKLRPTPYSRPRA